MDKHFEMGADFAKQLDRSDELAAFRKEFIFGDEDLIYMDGNSLGRLPRRTAEHLRNVVEQQWDKNW